MFMLVSVHDSPAGFPMEKRAEVGPVGEGMVVGERSLAAARRDDGDVRRFRKFPEYILRAGLHDAAAGVNLGANATAR